MKTTALAPWFGSKRTLAPEIVKLLGQHSCYWGLCCGSLAIELIKPPCPNETAVDMHGDLTNLAWVVQDKKLSVELFERLARTLASEESFLESQRLAKGDWSGELPNVDRAYAYFVASWLGRSGMAGTCRDNSQIAVRWTRNGGSPAKRFRSAVESIPHWFERLTNYLILRRSIFECIPKIEDEQGTAIYIDPPYLMKTRKGDRGGGKYRHEFAEADHSALAHLLSRFRKARVVVSYYADPELQELYPSTRWRRYDFTRNKSLSTQGRRGSKAQIAPEVVLVNNGDGEQMELFP